MPLPRNQAPGLAFRPGVPAADPAILTPPAHLRMSYQVLFIKYEHGNGHSAGDSFSENLYLFLREIPLSPLRAEPRLVFSLININIRTCHNFCR